MSKYLIIILLNMPVILIGILWSTVSYKTKKMSKKRFATEVVVWLLIGTSLMLIEPIYNSLIRNGLTDSPPLSLVDVIILTVLVLCLFLIERLQEKITLLNKKFSLLHEEMVIQNSTKPKKPSPKQKR